MKVSVIASGSKGNTTLIETDNTKILIDLGISCNKLTEELTKLNIKPKDINAVLITHAHCDHTKGITAFIKRYHPAVYLTEFIAKETELYNYQNIVYYEPITYINDLTIKVLRTSHYTKDSFGFVIKYLNEEVVYITDTGYIKQTYINDLKNKDIYIIESNHDPEMLINGPYPHFLKKRIWGAKGHLSNEDAANLLARTVGNKTKHIILAHLSHENNRPEIAINVTKQILNSKLKGKHLHVAKQNEPLSTIEVNL